MSWFSKLEIILGIWIIASPWILGYSKFTPALWNSVIVGAVIALLGMWRVFGKDLDEKIK